MFSHKTALQLVLSLTIGLAAAACSDDGDETGTSSTTSGASSTTSSTSAGQGGGTGGTDGQGGGTGGTDGQGGGTGGQGGGPDGQGGGTGGQGGASGEGGSGEGGSAAPSDPACGTDTATFAQVRTILNTSCAGATCHGSQNAPAAGLDLRANMAHGELVDGASSTCNGRVLVVPGKPSESYLINELRGKDLCATGKRMPPAPAPALSEANIKTISDWICAGAPE
ncbi:PE-PGRS family protein [Sorangium sp. So ce375]|uniref:PE-PGRS family protein n=1 Tax=Sorangium sp. So ce375 TaxID=3133306 RepID=UPI003F5C4B30